MRRTPRIPDHLLAGLPEKPLALAPLPDGAWLVATGAWFAVVGEADGDRSWEWHEVDQGGWDADAAALRVRWVTGQAESWRVLPPAPKKFLSAFRERVQHSVVYGETLPLKGTGQARAAVRRCADGSLISQLIVEGRSSLGADERKAIADLEARVRSAAGLGPGDPK